MLSQSKVEAVPSMQGGTIVRVVNHVGDTVYALRCFTEEEAAAALKHLYLLGAR